LKVLDLKWQKMAILPGIMHMTDNPGILIQPAANLTGMMEESVCRKLESVNSAFVEIF